MGVYVECYRFSIFVVTDSVYYKYQYSKTYTLCSGLNRLQVYVTEIKEKQIFQRIRWQTWALFECVFYKFAVPVVGCLTVAAGILARSKGVSKGTGTDQRFVKNALKNAELPPWFFQIFVFLLFLSHISEVYSNHYTVCMFYCMGIYNKHLSVTKKFENR